MIIIATCGFCMSAHSSLSGGRAQPTPCTAAAASPCSGARTALPSPASPPTNHVAGLYVVFGELVRGAQVVMDINRLAWGAENGVAEGVDARIVGSGQIG